MPGGARIVRNRIPDLKRHTQRHVDKAIDRALDAGVAEAKNRLRPGYGVDTGVMESRITSERTGSDSGRIVNPDGPKNVLNEFGTVHMPPRPHMRPAASAAGRVLRQELRDTFKGFR